jgi:ATP-dependent protease ClpP protease subunit
LAPWENPKRKANQIMRIRLPILGAFLVLLISLFSFFSLANAATTIDFSDDVSQSSVTRLISEVQSKANDGDHDILVRLHSRGGDLQAGLRGFYELRKFQITTSVNDDCSSACTVLFAAGKIRHASGYATFLFHGVGVAAKHGGMSDETIQAYRVQFANRWLAAIRLVSPALAQELQSKSTLLRGEREYRGHELKSLGYVTE